MSFFQWDPDVFGLDVPQMDDEHRELMSIMNALHEANESGESRATKLYICDQLLQYTRKHFADEEAYMDQIEYHDRENHKEIHRNLLVKLDRQVDQYRDSNQEAISPDFFEFLKLWLSGHIKGVDKSYASHATSKEKSA